jgi:peptidyl-prolyl cis-trans isomerase SurA
MRAVSWILALALSAPLALLAQTPRPAAPVPAGAPGAKPAEAPAAPAATAPAAAPAAPAAASVPPRSTRAADRVIAVVNDDVITENELRARVRQAASQLRAQNIPLPPMEQLRRQMLERMIVERAQLQLAKENGIRVDDATVNAALARIAETNRLTLNQLRERVEADGVSFNSFRENIRDEIVMVRLREREVESRLQIPETEVDAFLAEQAGVSGDSEELRIAQILLRVPEGASPARVEEVRRQAEDIATRARGGADFGQLAATYSAGAEALQGGDLGWRSADRIPNLFLDEIKDLKPGQVAPKLVRSPNGFHILKLTGKRDAVQAKLAGAPVQQSRVRHILLRVSDLTPEPDVKRRLEEFKGRIESKQADFATLARLHSVDPSGTRGGDLGWVYPGDTVPEFERAMNALQIGEVSQPVQSPFGWHLIQVQERRTESVSAERTRFAARQAMRERKLDEATDDWLRQLRDRAYVEIRPEEL